MSDPDDAYVDSRQDDSSSRKIGGDDLHFQTAEPAEKETEIRMLREALAKERARAEMAEKQLGMMASVARTYQIQEVGNAGNDKKRKHYTIPHLQINTAVNPHNRKPGYSKAEGEAVQTTISVDSWKNVENIAIPHQARDLTRDGDHFAIPITRVLGSKLDNGCGVMKTIEYENEACIQDFVKALVEDMVKCLGYGEILRVHVEMSIFSGVPDVVVVSWKSTPLLSIEFRSPEREDKKGEVFEAVDVARQVWNYLMGLKKIGHKIPIACLATYYKLVIVTAEDLAGRREHQDILLEMEKRFSSGIVDLVPRDVEKSQRCEDDKEPSPIKPTFKLADDLPKKTFGPQDETLMLIQRSTCPASIPMAKSRRPCLLHCMLHMCTIATTRH